MKIAIVGCGAVGSFYGAALARAGHELHFLLRSDYVVVRRQGVRIRGASGDFQFQPRCARNAVDIGPSDLVVIGLKTTANAELAPLLRPLMGASTVVLTLQNGLGNEEEIAKIAPASAILGGLCFVCLNRVHPGVIHHIDHGQVILGEFVGRSQTRTHGIAEMFRRGGVPCDVAENLAQAHWEKLTWNIPFNGLGVAGVAGFEAVTRGQLSPCHRAGSVVLTTDKILGDAQWTGLARALMFEVCAAARALGYHVPDSIAEKQIQRTLTMGTYKASTLIDFERGYPLELESLFLEPLRQAQSAGVATPRLEALCRVLSQLNPA